jgi:Lrp/AsnC family leucine-responsive transcriptional regulator
MTKHNEKSEISKLDLTDKKILCELDLNCRESISKIAHKLRVGRNVVSYRIKNLESQNIIKSYVCSINLGLLGYKTYKVFFKFNNQDKENDFVKEVLDNPNIIHCLRTSGSFDYTISIAVKTIIELDEIISGLKTKFNDLIKDYFISIVVYSKIFKYQKILLHQKEDQEIKINKYTSEGKSIDIDDIDKKILKTLSQEANISIVALSIKTKQSLDIVKYRLKKLQKELIISNRAIFDMSKLGYYHYVILMKTKNLSKTEENKLVSWCTYKNNVMFCSKRIGNYDFEINAAITSLEDLNSFITDLKEDFSGIIDSYEIILNHDLIKLNYIPF